MSRFEKILLGCFLAVWIWAAIKPKYQHDWMLENILVVIFVPIIIFGGRYFKLSELSFALLTVFMISHVIGSHYTFAEVPFGYTLQAWTGASRNMYDRLVHFLFGLLLAYPFREIFLRVARVKGFWSYYFPFDICLSMSAVYEIIEWMAASIVNPRAGLAFLGTQGDIWDAQKDIMWGGIGAAIAMVVIALINWRYDPKFARELKESFRIRRIEAPRGDSRLKQWFGPIAE